MLSTYILCLLVGFSAASDYAWKSDTEYQYQVRGRTLASLHQVDNQYAGIMIKAKFTVRPKRDGILFAKLHDSQYAQVHAKLPGGWRSEISESQLNYSPMQLSNKPFEIKMKNGTVQELIVDQAIPNWEANIIKSIVSQIQVDVQGENMIKSRYNQADEHQWNNAEYKTMEDSVTGKCETLYDINELPEYLLQSQPELAPLPHLKGDGEIIDIVKTRNYSNCDERIAYHYGLTEMDDWKPASASMGDFFLKSSVSRVIVSGTFKRHTIQSSVTTNKIVMKPTPSATHKGLVVSQLNITLSSVNAVSGQSGQVSKPKPIGNLVYRYNSPYAASNEVRDGSRNSEEHKYDTDSSSSDESRHRGRRSADQNAEKEHQYGRYDDSSSSSSSSSDSDESDEQWQQSKPVLTSPPETPLLPYTVGYKGQSIKNSPNFNIVQQVQKLARQIGEELQRPSDMPQEDTLAKFVILSNLIRSMNYKEIQEASRDLYNLKDKEQREQSDSWRTYRDAVAQAGTGPALLTIKDWIQSMKIRGEEAASIIACLARNTRTPTVEYMKTFYQLATDDKVQEQSHLNSTAILSFAELVRKVYVDQEGSHNQFPVHAFGKFYNQNNEAVHKQYIPYLAKELKEAIRETDSHKIQVYIRALGNIGHRQILSVFEPYLEGKKQISQFQRLMMVVSMDQLVREYPKTARSVLYKIYQNEGEASEIRVAAVHQLMRTSPPASMLQRMAHATYFDSSNQVSSAVKSAIETATQLEHPQYIELATNAQAAAPLLNPKSYGMHYSKQYLKDYVVREMNIAYKQHAGYLGSEDSIIPQGLMYSLRANLGGVKRQYINLAAMVSNVEDLFQVLDDQTEDDEATKYPSAKQQSQWAGEYIARLLKIKYDEREQLEGNVQLGMGEVKRFFTFDNQSIDRLPEYLKDMTNSWKQGKQFNYTKFYNPYEMIISFPTAMGLPFVYRYDTPTLVSVHGEIRVITKPEITSRNGDLQMPDSVNITAEIRTVVSTKTQAKLGFITPFDHQQYIAGFDKKVQVYLPLRTDIDIDVENQGISATFEPLDDESDEVFHYSSWPYTAKRDILSLKPVSQLSTAKIIHVREPQHYEHVFGKKAGMAFRVNATTEHKFADFQSLYEQYQSHQGFAALMSPITEDALIYTNINVQYDDELSHADRVNFLMGWNSTYFSGKSQTGETEFSQLYAKASELSDNDERQEYFLKKAAAGINNAEACVYDMSVQFEGKQNREYNATIAFGKSSVDKKSRVLFYYNKNASDEKDFEACFYSQNVIPNTNALDFVYALKFDPSTTTQMKLAFGEDCQTGTKINLKGKLEKSNDRQRYLQERPMAKLCREQMKEGNQQLYACRNMTARANFMDQYSFEIKYENMSPYVRNMTHKLYGAARHAGYPYLDENLLEGHGHSNQVSVDVDFEPDFQSVNITVETEKMQAEYNNIRVNKWVKAVVAVHPVFNVYDRLNGAAQNLVFNPTCVVDQSRVNTFDNKSYPIDLGKTWHVQMHHRVQRAGRQQEQGKDQQTRFTNEDNYDYVVLVRDADNKQRDVKIVLNDEQNYYEIDLTPAAGNAHSGSLVSGKVQVNQKPIQIDAQHSYDVEEDLLQIYALPNGNVKVEVNGDFYLIYDGERVKLTTLSSDQFRGEVRGLCGTFDGEHETDFLTPKNCILRNPLEFASTYAVLDSSSQGPAKERQDRAQKAACYEREVMYANVISPRDYRRHEQHQHEQSRHEGSNTCSKQQTQYVEENNGKTICFSLRPLPACRSGCKAAKKIIQNVEVHCVQKSNVSELWKNQIEKGASPDFGLKPVTKTINIKVSQSCSA